MDHLWRVRIPLGEIRTSFLLADASHAGNNTGCCIRDVGDWQANGQCVSYVTRTPSRIIWNQERIAAHNRQAGNNTSCRGGFWWFCLVFVLLFPKLQVKEAGMQRSSGNQQHSGTWWGGHWWDCRGHSAGNRTEELGLPRQKIQEVQWKNKDAERSCRMKRDWYRTAVTCVFLQDSAVLETQW